MRTHTAVQKWFAVILSAIMLCGTIPEYVRAEQNSETVPEKQSIVSLVDHVTGISMYDEYGDPVDISPNLLAEEGEYQLHVDLEADGEEAAQSMRYDLSPILGCEETIEGPIAMEDGKQVGSYCIDTNGAVVLQFTDAFMESRQETWNFAIDTSIRCQEPESRSISPGITVMSLQGFAADPEESDLSGHVADVTLSDMDGNPLDPSKDSIVVGRGIIV